MPTQNLAVGALAPCELAPPQPVKALFYAVGPADPGLLARLIEPVAKLGFVPARVHASSEAGDGSELVVELRIAALPARAALQIEKSLRAIVGVRQVIAVLEPSA